MIILDPRQGSGELLPLFRPYGVEVVSERLELQDSTGTHSLGDIMFSGWAEDSLGRPVVVPVGVERKKIGDLIGSMRSGRLSGFQLNGLCANFSFVWVLVEGIWTVGDAGEIVRPARGRWQPVVHAGRTVLYREVQAYLTTLRLKAGTEDGNRVIVDRTQSPKETVAYVVSLYRWFNDKKWSQHRSHEEIYAPVSNRARGHKPLYKRREVGITEKIAAQVPGFSGTAYDVAQYFKTPKRLVNAGVEDWAGVRLEQVLESGKKRLVKVGKKRAEAIVKLMEGG